MRGHRRDWTIVRSKKGGGFRFTASDRPVGIEAVHSSSGRVFLRFESHSAVVLIVQDE